MGQKLGSRAGLSLISLPWSLCNLWTAWVHSYLPILASRGTFGAAQAGLVPISAQIVNDWMPERRRGLASATVETAMSIGGIVTMGLTATLMARHDWRFVFSMYSWVGVGWALLFYLYFRNRPSEHPWANQAERDLIEGGSHAGGMAPSAAGPRAHPEVTTRQLFVRMLGSRNLWAICTQQFLRAAGYSLFVSWFPAFLEKGYGVTQTEAGFLTMVPLVAVVTGLMASGLLVDWLFLRTGSKRISRSLVAFWGLLLAALLTLCAGWASSAHQLVAVLALAVVLSSFSGPPSWTATLDIAGRFSALVMAIMNMAGNLGALLLPIALGYLIGHIERTGGDWTLVIYLIALIYLVAAAAWLAVYPDRKLTAKMEQQQQQQQQ